MVVLGLLMLVLAVLVTLGIALFNNGPTEFEAFGITLTNVSVGGLFLAGVVTGAVGALGLSLLLAGLARKRAKRVKVKREVSSARSEASALAEENARLHDQLEQTTTSTEPAPYPTETKRRGKHAPERR